jgi:hypothetical protein
MNPFSHTYQRMAPENGVIMGITMLSLKKLQDIAVLRTSIFSIHSLRRGGATLLAVAGPNHYIRSMMRSKSDSFLRYIHFAKGSMLQSQKTLLDPTIFTMADLLETSPSIWEH